VTGSLPDFVPPMLAKLGKAFDSDEHLFEVKWDGTRALAYGEGGSYRMLNRRRRVLVERYPEFGFLAGVEPGCVLDGEVVVFEDGRPSFRGMLQREQGRGERRFRELANALPATYVVFDLVYRGFESLEERPLTQRRDALREIVDAVGDPRLLFSDGITGAGTTFFEEVSARDIEGVVAKRLASRYHAGRRTDEWIKIKARQHIHCVILGYQAEGSDLRSLIIASDDGGTLRCVGKVGSGLGDTTRATLMKRFRGHEIDAPVVECPGLDGTWVEPSVFCTVSYLERSETGLRAPVFEGLVE
jgi:DNA ligase D-like protein (predicted ligase)